MKTRKIAISPPRFDRGDMAIFQFFKMAVAAILDF